MSLTSLPQQSIGHKFSVLVTAPLVLEAHSVCFGKTLTSFPLFMEELQEKYKYQQGSLVAEGWYIFASAYYFQVPHNSTHISRTLWLWPFGITWPVITPFNYHVMINIQRGNYHNKKGSVAVDSWYNFTCLLRVFTQ